MPDPPQVGRNAPCPCGSGRRFKHCCGREAATRYRALAAHRAGALGEAEALYRQALAENAGDVDALHMLGTVEYERMRYREALAHLWDAAERTAWSVPAIRWPAASGTSVANRTSSRLTDEVSPAPPSKEIGSSTEWWITAEPPAACSPEIIP